MKHVHILVTQAALLRSKFEIGRRGTIDYLVHLYADMAPEIRRAELAHRIPEDLPANVIPIINIYMKEEK